MARDKQVARKMSTFAMLISQYMENLSIYIQHIHGQWVPLIETVIPKKPKIDRR